MHLRFFYQYLFSIPGNDLDVCLPGAKLQTSSMTERFCRQTFLSSSRKFAGAIFRRFTQHETNNWCLNIFSIGKFSTCFFWPLKNRDKKTLKKSSCQKLSTIQCYVLKSPSLQRDVRAVGIGCRKCVCREKCRCANKINPFKAAKFGSCVRNFNHFLIDTTRLVSQIFSDYSTNPFLLLLNIPKSSSAKNLFSRNLFLTSLAL